MRNTILLATPDEVVEFVGTLWRTDEMRRSHNQPGGYVRKIVDRLARYPRIFYEMSESALETGHFTTWMNAIALRPYYANAAISDLYYLHEITHLATMTYADLPWNRWYSKMVRNEFETSLETEVFVYFHLPTLRERSFSHEIWADQFIQDGIGERFDDPLERPYLVDAIAQRRKRAMTTPDPFDFLDLQIANYLEQNQEWARIWGRNYRRVERQMIDFQKGVDQEHFSRSAALVLHLEWLMRNATESIPFLSEAQEFRNVYQTNKNKYGNVLLEAA